MPKHITVEVDGLTVDVDAKAYKADPEKVEADVRAARAELAPEPLSDDERELDYDTLYGKDA